MFDEDTSVLIEQGVVTFSARLATLTLTVPTNPVGSELAEKSTASIRSVLQARQVLTRRSFELNGPNITHHRDHGRRDIVIVAGTGEFKITGFAPDIRITAADGTVVRDTEADYVEEQRRLFYVSITRATETLVISRGLHVGRGAAKQLGLTVTTGSKCWPDLKMSQFLHDIMRRLPDALPGASWGGCEPE